MAKDNTKKSTIHWLNGHLFRIFPILRDKLPKTWKKFKEETTGCKLFIDDERFPAKNSGDWVIVRTSQEAIQYVSENGIPNYISFDHDLGGDDTSIKFLKWLENELLDEKIKFPKDFDFYVHSQNPIGAKNIRDWMISLINNF